MYAYNTSNVAYDLNAFDTDEREEQRTRQRAKNNIKLHKSSVAKSGNWFKTIVFVAFASLLAFAIVNSKATISELSIQINEQADRLEEAKSDNVRLQTNLDNLVTLSKVEESAVSELGLQKTSKNQVRYIEVTDRSLVQVSDQQENVFVSLKGWFDSTLEYLGF